MKRFACILLTAAFTVVCAFAFAGCGEPRDEILRVFIPGEYADPEVYDDFAEWYGKKTGKNIRVIETTFDTNESMLLKIERSRKDYDLVCPSDYMIEHMISKNLLLPLDKSVIDITSPAPANEDEEDDLQPETDENSADADGKPVQPLIKQTYLDITDEFDPDFKYTVPYMYGTIGIMYDYSKTKRHLDSWEYMFFNDNEELGSEFKKKLTQKESVREMYVSACIYDARNRLSELSGGFTKYRADSEDIAYPMQTAYHKEVQSIFDDTSLKTISAAKKLLLGQKKYVLKYESDDGKFGIAGGTLNAVGGLYWSCDAGYVMSDYEDDGGNSYGGNKNLWYVIPKEGGNVYIDGYVIPKYAANVSAANMFLKYICTQKAAVRNSVYAGAISPVTNAYDSLKEEYENDEEFFEGTAEGWREMYLDMLFPSNETLIRCGIMKDFKSNNSKINLMFADVVG